jgi:hypothetical protein
LPLPGTRRSCKPLVPRLHHAPSNHGKKRGLESALTIYRGHALDEVVKVVALVPLGQLARSVNDLNGNSQPALSRLISSLEREQTLEWSPRAREATSDRCATAKIEEAPPLIRAILSRRTLEWCLDSPEGSPARRALAEFGLLAPDAVPEEWD